jgi:hypothetical protein
VRSNFLSHGFLIFSWHWKIHLSYSLSVCPDMESMSLKIENGSCRGSVFACCWWHEPINLKTKLYHASFTSSCIREKCHSAITKRENKNNLVVQFPSTDYLNISKLWSFHIHTTDRSSGSGLLFVWKHSHNCLNIQCTSPFAAMYMVGMLDSIPSRKQIFLYVIVSRPAL